MYVSDFQYFPLHLERLLDYSHFKIDTNASKMDSSTTIVNINWENLEKLMDYMGSVVGVKLSKPENVSEFTALMVTHADALIAGADDVDVEGCFQVLFKDIQVDL